MAVAPFVIEIMLACHASSDPVGLVGEDRWDSEAGIRAREFLKENELINDNCWATERGKAWIRFICDMPLPVQEWVLYSPPSSEGGNG